MRIEAISTGTELLKGSATNRDLALLGQLLGEHGITVSACRTVGDSREELIGALADALREADVVLISGGLGPTRDDVTRDVTAEFFGLPLERDVKYSSYLRYLWRARRGEGKIPADYFRQADRPAGAEFLPNENGTAPGILLKTSYAGRPRMIFLLPGPPVELAAMAAESVVPLLAASVRSEYRTQGFLIAGGGELLIQQRVEPLLKNLPVELSYCASHEGTRFFVSGDASAVEEAIALAEQEFHGDALPPGEFSLAGYLVRHMTARKLKMALAESCTGGMIAASITDVPGASAVFQGGIVAYDNAVKINLLGVSEAILNTEGAVSAACAEAMALGAQKALGADLAGSVTGIAGPDGGTPDKPVGTVFITARLGERQVTVENHFRGDRDVVRRRSRAQLLLMFRELLAEDAGESFSD